MVDQIPGSSGSQGPSSARAWAVPGNPGGAMTCSRAMVLARISPDHTSRLVSPAVGLVHPLSRTTTKGATTAAAECLTTTDCAWPGSGMNAQHRQARNTARDDMDNQPSVTRGDGSLRIDLVGPTPRQNRSKLSELCHCTCLPYRWLGMGRTAEREVRCSCDRLTCGPSLATVSKGK